MRIAVVGAGIVGVATAYELAADGHAVTVFERHAAVASETSFANAGVVAPGYVTPWAAPGMPRKVLGQLFGRHAAVRFGGPDVLRHGPWFWRWWRACRESAYRHNRTRLYRLARYSRDRLRELAARHALDYERTQPLTVLLREAQDLARAEGSLRLLREWEVPHQVIDAARCREIEPGLHPATPLHAAITLPDDEVGNCRQFAHGLKAEAQRLGATFRFGVAVDDLAPPRAAAAPVTLRLRSARGAPAGVGCQDAGEQLFDAVVVCTGHFGNQLLGPLGLRLPLLPVYGYSVTAPLRATEGGIAGGPRGALMDERYKVAISRLGQRVRVAGSAEIGGRPDAFNRAALATLHRVLDDWFPGSARLAQAQAWKGARPMLPDGVPAIGASAAPGVWLNLGHGSSGWALACGSARLLADAVGGRAPELDIGAYAPPP
jgi:D-amino-acid dehydrogenase